MSIPKEHVEAMKAIINEPDVQWSDRLDKLIKYKKEHLGLIGARFTFFPDKELDLDAEKMAHDVCMMELAHLEGRYKDATGEVL